MTDDEFDELIELRKKVRLTPNYHPLSRLADLYAMQQLQATYTKEEIESLLAQFKELPTQEQQELLDSGYKQNPNFFNLSEAEREKLRAARKQLSLSQRARISDTYTHTAAGIAWLDIGEVSNTFIELDDRSSKERETRPYAHIYFSDHYHRRVETIDILESVKNDSLAVGHPAVMFAIYHWQRVVYTKRVIERRDITFKDEWGQYFVDEFRGGRDVRSAERNLKAISETLYDAAEKRAIPIESALALKMQECDLLGPNERDTVVYKAWETLKGNFIRRAANAEEVLQKIEPMLETFGAENDSSLWPIRAGRVLDFLKDAGEKGGRRFVWFNSEGNLPRQKWVAFRNAFAAWFFDLGQATVQRYLEKAPKQNVVLDDIYQPSMVYPTTTVARIQLHLLTRPLVAVREPVLLSESDIRLDGIEDAIKKATSDSD